MSTTILMDVKVCPRCEKEHAAVMFHPLDAPIERMASHFGTCPETQLPILVNATVTVGALL